MINAANPRRDERFIGNWMWLFPVAYLGHIAEEHWADFNAWIARFWQVESSDTYFLLWNFAAVLGMVVGVLLVLKTKSCRWLIVGFGVAVLINGLLHLITSITTWTYSPGLITSLFFWFPLATITWRRARAVKMNSCCLWAGVLLGVITNIVILIFVFCFPKIFAG